MKKVIINAMILLLLINLTGCNENFLPSRKEIDDLQLVQVIGIDKSSDNNYDFMVTIASKNLEQGGGQEGSGDRGGTAEGASVSNIAKALVLTSKGKTIFEAVRNIQTHSSKTIFWGHSDYYLIGEDAARENIAKYIDILTRDHELRIESKIYIVKGSTAKELIEQFNQSGFYISDKLDSLGQNLKLQSISEEMRIHELMRFLDVHHSSARVPCIILTNRDSGNVDPKKDIESCGYAIFSDLKLVGFIGADISRGVNLIANTVGSSIVAVKDLEGQDVSLEIIRSNTDIIPYFKGDDLQIITIKTKVDSNLGEIQSQTDFATEKSLSHMEAQQSKILKNEMEKVLEKIIHFKSDCLGICDRVRLKRPIKWHKIEDKWMDIWPNIKFDIQVESRIRRTYEMREPSGYKGKE